MKRTLIFIMLFMIKLSISSGLTMEQAIRDGIALNAAIQNSKLESKILEVDNRIRRSGKWFSLSGAGTYLYKSEKTEITMPDITIAPGMSITGLKIEGGVRHNFDFKIALSQPIFTGYSLSGMVNMNEIEQTLNISKRELLELMLTGRIKSVFFNYRILSSQLDSLTALNRKINNHLKKLEDLFSEDLVGKSQVLETRLKQKEIALSVTEAENGISRIASTFAELTGHEIENIGREYTEEIPDRDMSMKLFTLGHPELKILSDTEKMIRISKKMVRGKNLPRIGGFAEFHYGVPGINFIGDEWTHYFQGGIEVRLKLFDWSKSRRENLINDYNLEKIDTQKKDLIRRTRLQISDLFSTLKNLQERIRTYEEMIRIAIEESEVKKHLFSEKQISNRDYIDSVLNVETLRSLKDKADLQAELIKVEINIMIGKKGEK